MSGADFMCKGYCELLLRASSPCQSTEMNVTISKHPDQEDHQPYLAADVRRSLKFHPSIIHVVRFNSQTGRELGTVITCLMEENKWKEDRADQGASPSSSPPEPGHTYHIGPSFSDHSYRSSELLAEMFISGTKLIRRRMLAEISMRKISCSGLTLLTVWHSGRLLMTSTWSSSFLKPRKGEIFHWYHDNSICFTSQVSSV